MKLQLVIFYCDICGMMHTTAKISVVPQMPSYSLVRMPAHFPGQRDHVRGHDVAGPGVDARGGDGSYPRRLRRLKVLRLRPLRTTMK